MISFSMALFIYLLSYMNVAAQELNVQNVPHETLPRNFSYRPSELGEQLDPSILQRYPVQEEPIDYFPGLRVKTMCAGKQFDSGFLKCFSSSELFKDTQFSAFPLSRGNTIFTTTFVYPEGTVGWNNAGKSLSISEKFLMETITTHRNPQGRQVECILLFFSCKAIAVTPNP